MSLAVHRAVRGRLPVARLERLLAAAVRRYRLSLRRRPLRVDVSLAVVGEADMRRLNRLYRRRRRVTDVLSFPYGSPLSAGAPDGWCGGEVVICYPAAERQARAHGLTMADELSLLFVHGLLHCFGFDHHTAEKQKKMAKAETEILGYSGLVTRAGHRLNVKVRIQKSKVKLKNQKF